LAASFVGRRKDLALLEDQLDKARAGQPRVVLIEGAAGIGKTALLNRFLAQTLGAQILRASGEESELLLAYGVVDQLLRSAAGAGASVEPRPIPLQDHLAVGAQVLELLGNLQEQGPVVVFIDDLQWADQPSLKALLFALRRLLADRVIVLLVNREEEVDDGRLEGLSRLIRDRDGIVLHLRGIQVAELQELAQLHGLRSFSARAARRLHEHTEGHPLHTEALLDEIPAADWDRHGLYLPAPRSLSLLVLDRRAQCSGVAQRLVDAASVLGVRCSLDGAACLACIGNPLSALDEASRAGLLHAVMKIG
jgi:hypothetical protein